MLRLRSIGAALGAALVLGACAETPISPTEATPSFQADAVAESNPASGSFLVRASGNGFPRGFTERVAELGGRVVFAHDGAGVGAVEGLTAAAADQLARFKGVASVDDDNFTTLAPLGDAQPEAFGPGVNSAANPAASFFYARQWNMRQVEAPAAWAAGRLGKSTTRVGILDTGLDYTSLDLVGRVDLGASVSFVTTDQPYIDFYFPGAHPIADLFYHGTHVGATVVSNGVVGAGITSGVTLVGIKVCDVFGSCPTSAVLAGVLYAADQGLPVANMSLGGSFQRKDASGRGGVGPSFVATINQVFNYASRKGTLVVVSAGNAASDMDHDGNAFKAYCSAAAVVCVSATGPTAQGGINGPWTNPDALASYSNFGRSSINVAAPGGNNATRVWASCSHFSLQVSICQTGNYIIGVSGTSMAAPHVTGLAALISEDVGASPARIRAQLQQSSDDLGTPGTDPAYGKGRINVRRALGLQ